jgi:hypothetical protein
MGYFNTKSLLKGWQTGSDTSKAAEEIILQIKNVCWRRTKVDV